MTSAELENNFKYHPPTVKQIELYQQVRERFRQLAVLINSIPTCREQSTALTHLETSMFWTNAGIARTGHEE